jgi:hypothetical protein
LVGGLILELDEFRSDLLASAASRAEAHATGTREAFVGETLERLRDAGELPDAEECSERVDGQRNRRLEIDAFAFDEADESLNLFIAVLDGSEGNVPAITLTDAREQGFNRLLGIFEQARDGWLTANIEESRPLWALAKQIQSSPKPLALRLHVVTDRPISERLREIPPAETREEIPITFQIWDVTRLKRIQEAQNARDDLFVDLSGLPDGGLPMLRASVGDSDYDAYLAVIPGETLADIYIRHGSRLLEGNVRTFLGRRGNVNKGIANTLAKEAGHFFAYNNGIAATASAVTTTEGSGRMTLITGITDLQIVNGAQTTASLAALRRDKKLPEGEVFVPMKLSVVAPEIAIDLVPRISRFANSQNSVRASDFFANHEFHRRIEQISRRILAPAIGGSQVQTHWYYERARGQHLNDQAGMTPAKRDQFLRMNPRNQVITKTDLAKIESCFDLLPDVACKGAEKSFVAFADRVTEAWKDERKRSLYTDDWFRAAAARTILFRAAEAVVLKAPWYAPGTRSQVVAYTMARLAVLGAELSEGGRLDYLKVWAAQGVDSVMTEQIYVIAEHMMGVLATPPKEGQHVGEWAKQQACRSRALQTDVPIIRGFETFLIAGADAKADDREYRDQQRVTDGLAALTEVMELGAVYWEGVRAFGRSAKILSPKDDATLGVACAMPRRMPNDKEAVRLIGVRDKCTDVGFETEHEVDKAAS